MPKQGNWKWQHCVTLRWQMFLILFMEYNGKNILEFVRSSRSIGLLRKKRSSQQFFRQHPESSRFDANLTEDIAFWSRLQNSNSFWWGKNCFEKNGHREQILRWILYKNRVLTPFSDFWILHFEIIRLVHAYPDFELYFENFLKWNLKNVLGKFGKRKNSELNQKLSFSKTRTKYVLKTWKFENF